MKIAFVHQNFPGQFLRLARSFAAEGHEVVGLGMVKQCSIPGVKYFSYEAVPGPDDAPFQNRYSPVIPRLRRAYGVAHKARALAAQGFQPDVVVVNTGWGENLFLKDVWPKARHVAYFEYYYHAKGQDLDFDPEFPITNEEVIWRLRAKNAMQLGALDVADLAVAPTRYQRDTFPDYLRDRLAIIHDGIDTKRLLPDPAVKLRLGQDGPQLTRDKPVVTYVTRNIEPMRGAHVVFKSLPYLLDIDPELRVVIVGGKGTSYSGSAPGGKSWFDVFKERIERPVDWSRIHFVGNLPYDQFVKVLQVSSAHVYMTYPFVLSWSSIESMALECRIVASDTEPVREIIEDGVNGRLFPFFDEKALAERVRETLADKERSAAMAAEARRIAVAKYDYETVCLPQWRDFLGIK
ncbi:glycosyltransferase [Microvirga arsenatis]|uniref:Glycosyltransferase n=1 Tax=Microvirga arsenatis TaxID=2692265 RepID=A0ABW9Z0E7_9HYPH|nr:glycosyltransferase [Microvirga arsenatis]NBJ12161.1 glycosyltransferase [Microvirga arsenatis]NBJ25813.1 glycosyltransferase [Microvirga arsenatis]